MQQSELTAKRDKIHKEMSAAKKRECIGEMRRALVEARFNERKEEEEEIEFRLMSMFRDKEEYEHCMKLIEEHEKD